MKITPTTLSVNQLFGSPNEQYVVPAYQRRYSWHEKQVGELIDDVLAIEDGETHLLGSVVCLADHHKAGLNELELVDGQQRVTTVSILLECIKERLEREKKAEEASELRQLLSAKLPNGTSAKKIVLGSIDADEYADLIQGNVDRPFKNQNLARAFELVRERSDAVSLDEIRSFLYKLRNQAIVIRLDVGHAKDAFKLFETINNRGLKLSPTDIIKNFLLGNAARLGQGELGLARKNWTELLGSLDGTNSDAFFRYFLMASMQRRLVMSEVVTDFKDLFMNEVAEAEKLPGRKSYGADDAAEEDEEAASAEIEEGGESDRGSKPKKKVKFKEFIERLTLCARIYGELQLARTGDKRIDRHLRNLRMIKAVQTYGYLMHLRAGGCGDKEFREILKMTESFVLRRHVCQRRANETEALFARLCGNEPKSAVGSTRDAYRSLCPDDEDFKHAFAHADFPATLIDRARYCLEKIENSKHGDYDELHVLGADDVHVEHIMPQQIRGKKERDRFGDWVFYLGKNSESLHQRYVGRIGNLTLFAGELNIGASNNPFARKKSAYRESAILLTQELAKLPNFKFSNIETRSKVLADVAVKLWPKP